MKKLVGMMMVLALALVAPMTFAEEEEKPTKAEKKEASVQEERDEINKVADEALAEVLKDAPKADDLFSSAAGWAVFDNMRVTFIITGGGGHGVAVNKASGKRTFMKMGSGGLAFGIGAQKYQVIMFFDTEERLTNFIEKGWKAETGANAAAGTAGANVATAFIDGIAVYQITEAGLMASADVSGTKYMLDKDLNYN
jgi:lipid-binding SYLF domain-containing protein